MPQQNQSGKLDESSSPVVNRVIQNNKDVQEPVNAPGNIKPGSQFNKTPVPVK